MNDQANATQTAATAERAVALDDARLDALLQLGRMFDASVEEIIDFAMEEAVRLTESEIGYVALMSEDESVLTMQAWSAAAMHQCGLIEKPIVYPINETGLWGEAVRQRRPILTNDYDAPNPMKRGYPKGHVPVKRHMNIPVFDGPRIVAVAGVGNKPRDYDEGDVRQLELLMAGMWKHILRRRNDEELRKYRDELEVIVQERTRQVEETNAELEQTNEELTSVNQALSQEIIERRQAEEALRRSEEKFRSVVENINIGVALIDRDGRVMFLNGQMRRWFPKIDAAALPRCFEAFNDPPRETPCRPCATQQTLCDGAVHETITATTVAGQTRNYRIVASPVFDEQGEVAAAIELVEDVTDRLAVEAARREAQLALQQRTVQLEERVKELNCLFHISRLTEDSHGSVEDFLSQAVAVIPAAWQWPEAACARIVVGGRAFQTPNFRETLWKQASPLLIGCELAGAIEVCYLHDFSGAAASPFLDEEQQLLDAIAERVGRIVERHQAQSQLRDLNRRIEFILGATRTGLDIIDAHWRLVYVDPAWQKIYGDPAGKTCYEYFCHAAQPCGSCCFEESLRTKKVVVREEILQREGNRPVQVTSIPFQDEQGNWLVAQVNVDLTERKRMEAELAQAQRLEAVGHLAAGIAHEINTPTQYIGDNIRFLQSGFDELDSVLRALAELSEAPVGDRAATTALRPVREAAAQADVEYLLEEIPKAIQQSLDGVQRVSTIVRAMKEFSHPGRQQKQRMALDRMIETTLTVARNEWKYVADAVADCDPNLPPIDCRPGELQQALLNLVVNAAQAIAEKNAGGTVGKGTIAIRARAQGAWVEIRVEDTGTGIDPAILPRIFDPFFTTKEVGHGTGQGLAMVHAIVVERHQGSISVESAPGAGAAFIIRLPVCAGDPCETLRTQTGGLPHVAIDSLG